jgi:hypothetical protein
MVYRVIPVGPSDGNPPFPINPLGTSGYPAPALLYYCDGNGDEEVAGLDLDTFSNFTYGQCSIIPPNAALGYRGQCFWNDDNSAASGSRTNVDMNGFNTGNSVTIACLVNNTEPNETINGIGGLTGNETAWMVHADYTINGFAPVFTYTNSGSTLTVVTSTLYVPQDAWTFCIFRRVTDPGVDCDITFFLNGLKEEQLGLAAPLDPMTSPAPGAKIEIGRGTSSTNEMNGGIGQFAVWSSALTDDECYALTAAVVPWYNT